MKIRTCVIGLLLAGTVDVSAQQIFESAFDESLDPWQGYGATADSLDIDVGRLGASLRIDGSGTVFANVYLPGDETGLLRISGYIRTSGASSAWLAVAGLTGRCAADEVPPPISDASDWTPFRLDILPDPEIRRVEVQAVAGGEGTAWFDDLSVELVPPQMLPSAADEVLVFLEGAIDTIQAHVLNRAEVLWDQVRADARRRIRGATRACEAWSSIEQVFDDIGEPHGWHQTPAEVRWYENNGALRRDFSIPSTVLTDRVGYVGVPGLPSTHAGTVERFAGELQERVESLAAQGVCRWIVDLRDNTGGNMWPMLAGIGWLLGEGEAGAFRGPDGAETWGFRSDGAYLGDETRVGASERPSSLQAQPPVAVLYGPRTASSGEAIAVAFRGRSLARSFGSPTQGVSTSTEVFPLPDGSRLVFANRVFEDRDGIAYGGALVPNVEVSSPRVSDPSEDPTVRAALQWLAGQACEQVR